MIKYYGGNMVDCVYYEEMNIDKEAIKKQFIARFGNEYDLHCGISNEGYVITANDIVNPSVDIYAEVLCGLSNKFITTTKFAKDINYKRYYNSLYLLAMIKKAVASSIIDEFEIDTKIQTLRQTLKEDFNY